MLGRQTDPHRPAFLPLLVGNMPHLIHHLGQQYALQGQGLVLAVQVGVLLQPTTQILQGTFSGYLFNINKMK